ncbi:MAG TPA: ATP-binding protein [Pyrinomonadaceae bacterium]
MSSTVKPNSAREGETVYRRVAGTTESPPGRPDEPRLDPTLMPLLVGCALLLLFVIVLGNLSVRRVEDTSRQVLILEQQYAARADLLLQFRIALTRLDNEARAKREAEARKEIRPPFDMRLGTAREELSKLVLLLDRVPLEQLPKWRAFRENLLAYIEITKDNTNYSQNGFEKFRQVDLELNDIIHDTSLDQAQVSQQADTLANSAARSIKILSLIAILASLFVTAGTIWVAQRRYRQTRSSTEAARREREFSNQMLEGMVSAIVAIDRHDRIRSANVAFLRIFPNAAVGASIHGQVGSPEGVQLLEAATASRVEASTYRGRWQLSEDGVSHTFDVYSSPLEIDGERGQILTLVDVTEAVKSEAARRRSEALAAVGEAAAQLAHEIKNPLGSIRLGVEMLREHAKADDAVRTITLVERGILHLNKLVVDVTQFSRRRQLDRSEFELHEVIDSSIDLVRDRIQDKETPVEKHYWNSDIHGVWDGEQLLEVFVNLFANAIDASEKGAPLRISTELIDSSSGAKLVGAAGETANRSAVRITIMDKGAGMDAKTQARLFEPFFTTKKKGTGLGLSIVRQIVEMHGGSIDLISEKGEGTTFTIDLPLKPRTLGGNGLQ